MDEQPPEKIGGIGVMMARPCDMLPPVRGSLSHGAPLKDLVWFRAGGPAEVLFRPADSDDLAAFLAARPADLKVSVIGVGSNLLVRDGGIPGVVVRLSSAFGKIETDGLRVRAGAAALDGAVARAAADAGIAGLEFLRGVPGTIGGALRMNAGCYGSEIKDVFVEATAIDEKGNKIRLSAADMGFEYRKARGAAEDLIFVEAVFEGRKDNPTDIRARMDELSASREASQPIKSKTGGSTFKNPPGHKAWQLIDQAGCRGLKIGGAQVSEKHTNFLINTGDASAADLEGLGEEVRKRVKEKSGVTLEWEIKRVGVA
jgi:UDP-N-acetylmuramate dehydrogenase